jgi:uncharacterized membrane protein YbhN (UPF0104 family)
MTDDQPTPPQWRSAQFWSLALGVMLMLSGGMGLLRWFEGGSAHVGFRELEATGTVAGAILAALFLAGTVLLWRSLRNLDRFSELARMSPPERRERLKLGVAFIVLVVALIGLRSWFDH